MDIRERFLDDLEALYRRYEHEDDLNGALAVLALLGAAVTVEAEETMCEMITPLARAFIIAHRASKSELN